MKSIFNLLITVVKLPIRLIQALLRIVGIGRDKNVAPASKKSAKKAKAK